MLEEEEDAANAPVGLRALDVLLAIAQTAPPRTLRVLHERLDLPRASLHRLLRLLETSGYLVAEGGSFALGPRSFRLAALIGVNAPPRSARFPDCARPVLEWLASETNETTILGALSERREEIVYADVIIAESPLQYAVPAGDRRPLHSSATGKAVLAFLSPAEQRRYLGEARFEAVTPFTTRADQIGAMLDGVRAEGVIHDRDGHFVGAGAIASPIFDAAGAVFAAVVVAGPNERLDPRSDAIKALVREAATGISQLLGYEGRYPPAWPPVIA